MRDVRRAIYHVQPQKKILLAGVRKARSLPNVEDMSAMDRWIIALWVALAAYIALGMADYSATWRGISAGGMEGNPVFAPFAYAAPTFIIGGLWLEIAYLLLISVISRMMPAKQRRAVLITGVMAGAAAHLFGALSWA
jgi:hypothetical protein